VSRRDPDHGGALLEVLTIGFAVVFLVVQAILAMGRLQEAGERVTETAQMAAVAAARTGDVAAAAVAVRRTIPGADVTIEREGREYRVEVSMPVALLGPGSGAVHRTVTGRATATASPYRGGP
jgi:hypothetical protein